MAASVLCCVLSLLLPDAWTTAPGRPGNVLRIGAGQPFATVNAALAVARDGDLLLVDPGTYPGFLLDGRSVVIASSGGAAAPFRLVQPAGQPAVAIRNLPAGREASLLHCVVEFRDGGAPAIRVAACGGGVRLVGVTVEPVGDLPDAAARAAVEVVDCAALWTVGLRIWPSVPRVGNTTALQGAPIDGNAGLCGVLLQDSAAVLDHPVVGGFDNGASRNGVSWGGDGLRLLGRSTAWVLREPGLPSAVLRGGAGLTHGGSAIHFVRAGGTPVVETCGPVDVVPGAGATAALRGGYLAIDNDRGLVAWSGGTAERYPPACLLESVGMVTVPAPVVAPGGVALIRVASLLPRWGWVLGGVTSVHASIAGIQGRALLDPQSPGTVLLATGPVGPAPTVLAVPVPPDPGLVGLQLTLQGALGPPAGMTQPVLSLTMPAVLVVGR